MTAHVQDQNCRHEAKCKATLTPCDAFTAGHRPRIKSHKIALIA